MSQQPKSEFHQISVGYEFPPQSYKLEAESVAMYLQAVGEGSGLYAENQLVPPMAIAANALAALGESISIPPGGIHVSQELEFQGEVIIGETITCKSRVSRKVDRGGLHMLTINIEVFNQAEKKVLAGKVGFVLP